MSQIGTNRKLHIDILRILAAFLVIYNHTRGYHFFLDEFSSIRETGWLVVLSVITRLNVPVFFMLSGALLLGKEESYRILFSKRVLRFVAVLICASVVTYVFYNRSFQPLLLIDALLTANVTTQYWFLYTYLGFLLTLPFLRKIAGKLEEPDFLLLLGGVFLLRIAPNLLSYITQSTVHPFPGISGSFATPFLTTEILFYPLVGYYCENKVSLDTIRKRLIALILVFVAGTLGSAAFTIHQGLTGEFTQNYLGLFTPISAPCAYLLVKYAISKLRTGAGLQKAVHTLGSLTLGIYLMDPLFHHFLYNRLYNPVALFMHPVTFSLIYCVVSMVVCSLATYVLRKIPIAGKLL